MRTSNFNFIEKTLPEIYGQAIKAEQTLDSNPMISLIHLKQMGRLFIEKILFHEDLKIEPKGIYQWSDGTKYSGQWYRDTEYGWGEKYYAGGDTYQGEWKEGLFHGIGIYQWKDGTRFEGRWEENLEHGYGMKTHADGSIQKGIWTYGEFIYTKDQLKEP